MNKFKLMNLIMLGSISIYSQNVGIGTTTPNVKLQVLGGTEATLINGSGYILIGDQANQNIIMDNNELQSRNNGATAPINLQPSGGNTLFGNGNINTTGKMGIGSTAPPASNFHIFNGSDASLTSNGFMVLGSLSGPNIVIDDNEIIARNDSAASTLTLQNNGGNVYTGANLEVNGVFLGNIKIANHLFILDDGNTTNLSVGNNTYIKVKNNSFTPTPTIVISNGEYDGQLLILTALHGSPPYTGEGFVLEESISNVDLNSSSKTIKQGDFITLMWTGATWNQLSYSDN